MPIYEYFCVKCQGRFRHLARRINEGPPACPGCGAMQAERLISVANVSRGDAYHRQALKEEAAEIDGDDPRAIAEFLEESGRLQDSSGLFGSRAYKEVLARRLEGAVDADLDDLVDDLAAALDPSDALSEEAGQMASALAMSDRVENRLRAEGPPEERDQAVTSAPRTQPGAPKGRVSRSVKDLGWG